MSDEKKTDDPLLGLSESDMEELGIVEEGGKGKKEEAKLEELSYKGDDFDVLFKHKMGKILEDLEQKKGRKTGKDPLAYDDDIVRIIQEIEKLKAKVETLEIALRKNMAFALLLSKKIGGKKP